MSLQRIFTTEAPRLNFRGRQASVTRVSTLMAGWLECNRQESLYQLSLCLLQTNLGYPDEMLEKIDVTEPIVPLPRPAVPPFNGYGTLDDSKQNCVALVPKPPKKVSL